MDDIEYFLNISKIVLDTPKKEWFKLTVMDKNKEWKALRVLVHKEDWDALKRQATEERLPLATWVRQKVMLAVKGDKG